MIGNESVSGAGVAVAFGCGIAGSPAPKAHAPTPDNRAAAKAPPEIVDVKGKYPWKSPRVIISNIDEVCERAGARARSIVLESDIGHAAVPGGSPNPGWGSFPSLPRPFYRPDETNHRRDREGPATVQGVGVACFRALLPWDADHGQSVIRRGG